VKKLHLDPDTLQVQSFDVGGKHENKGTVFGRETLPYDNSCGATYCADCAATDPNVDCGDGNSGQCDSVNIAYCQSAYYTDCCGGDASLTICRYSADFYNPAGIGCT